MIHVQIADHMRMTALEPVSEPEVLISQLVDLGTQALHFVLPLAPAASVARCADVNKKTGDKYTNREGRDEWDQPLYPSRTTHDLENLLPLDTSAVKYWIHTAVNSSYAQSGKSAKLFRFVAAAIRFVALARKLLYNPHSMIAYLSGKLLEKQPGTVIIDVGGVGYEVSIPLSTFYELGETASDVSLRIYTHVREDAIQLYGFKTLRERDLFLRLISVQGVGAKLGIAMLSGMSADDIVMAIRTDDLARLTGIPGVGRKTAERLVIDLRDKVGELSGDARSAVDDARPTLPKDAVFDDALSALVNLGYQRNSAEKALNQAAKEGTEISVQKLLRRSLQILAK